MPRIEANRNTIGPPTNKTGIGRRNGSLGAGVQALSLPERLQFGAVPKDIFSLRPNPRSGAGLVQQTVQIVASLARSNLIRCEALRAKQAADAIRRPVVAGAQRAAPRLSSATDHGLPWDVRLNEGWGIAYSSTRARTAHALAVIQIDPSGSTGIRSLMLSRRRTRADSSSDRA